MAFKLSKGMYCQLQQCLQQSVSFKNDNTRGDHCLHIPTNVAQAATQFSHKQVLAAPLAGACTVASFSLMSPQLQLHLVFSPLSSLLMDPTDQ
jgi:hypothetical protein